MAKGNVLYYRGNEQPVIKIRKDIPAVADVSFPISFIRLENGMFF